MKLTELTIAPTRKYRTIDDDNPLRAVVKLQSDHSTVECVLSDATMQLLLDICADEIAENAAANIQDFRAAVMAITGRKSTALIGDN